MRDPHSFSVKGIKKGGSRSRLFRAGARLFLPIIFTGWVRFTARREVIVRRLCYTTR
jgi:hypothetical protein